MRTWLAGLLLLCVAGACAAATGRAATFRVGMTIVPACEVRGASASCTHAPAPSVRVTTERATAAARAALALPPGDATPFQVITLTF